MKSYQLAEGQNSEQCQQDVLLLLENVELLSLCLGQLYSRIDDVGLRAAFGDVHESRCGGDSYVRRDPTLNDRQTLAPE